ncbi:Protein FAR1-RELATED SEQUENCE [Abeliophyllum distichum]|uniref:Protein FAR1-RELATED SEQUENCE n=1 Tax=Abeliophyllum distichum TaxID=126358 RepID=A0ABD1QGS4_9LAMI
MISYFRKKQVLFLPKQYILRRWTNNAKVGEVHDPRTILSSFGGSSTSLMARHRLLAHKSSMLIDDDALTVAHTTFLMGEFDSLHIRIKDIDDGRNSGFSKQEQKLRSSIGNW